jgi:hypothetical protein
MTKTKKKTTKAVTLLTRIGTLLSDVIDDCSGIEKSVEKNAKEVLVAAQKSIASALEFFSSAAAPAVAPKAAAKPKAVAKKKAAPAAKVTKRVAAPAAKKRAVKA